MTVQTREIQNVQRERGREKYKHFKKKKGEMKYKRSLVSETKPLMQFTAGLPLKFLSFKKCEKSHLS
jgi:hypothetical protein